MQYIASKGIVHRDLAARNILLCGNSTAKISDFGLRCSCNENFTYKTKGAKKLPIKWLSIEALNDWIFSEKSDVWSFGVLMYEVFSLGKTPYNTLQNDEILGLLQTGARLEQPEYASSEMYRIMCACWDVSVERRPPFYELEKALQAELEKYTDKYEPLLETD